MSNKKMDRSVKITLREDNATERISMEDRDETAATIYLQVDKDMNINVSYQVFSGHLGEIGLIVRCRAMHDSSYM